MKSKTVRPHLPDSDKIKGAETRLGKPDSSGSRKKDLLAKRSMRISFPIRSDCLVLELEAQPSEGRGRIKHDSV
jgi:hypothetical protein